VSELRAVRRHHPYLFLLPTALVLGLFFIYPVALAFYRSFFAWDLLTAPTFVGTAHYAQLLAGGDLVGIIARTFAYSVCVVTGAGSLGLLLAVWLNRPGAGYAFVRGSIFSAYIVSWVAVALLWLWILDPDAGAISRALQGVGFDRIDWLGDPDVALYTLAAVSVWKITGYAMVIFLAGLQDIPKSVLEAAALDGASPWRRFWHVTWPLLRPTTAFVGTTSLIMSFQAFDIVRVMTQGGPIQSTTVFVYAIYEQIFMNLRVGRASALTVVFFVFLLLLTGAQLWLWRRASRRHAEGAV
jgi:sn-glycerol 3-phosphate transport system permease protein